MLPAFFPGEHQTPTPGRRGFIPQIWALAAFEARSFIIGLQWRVAEIEPLKP